MRCRRRDPGRSPSSSGRCVSAIAIACEESSKAPYFLSFLSSA